MEDMLMKMKGNRPVSLRLLAGLLSLSVTATGFVPVLAAEKPVLESEEEILLAENEEDDLPESEAGTDDTVWKNRVAVLESGTIGERLQTLQSQFPAGSYWNHLCTGEHREKYGYTAWDDPCNQPDAVTNVPCVTHTIDETYYDWQNGEASCNFFDWGVQCDGFARMLFYKIFGRLVSEEAEFHPARLEDFAPGDFCRTKNGHSFLVVGLDAPSGQLITVDANNTVPCRIQWGTLFNPADVSYAVHASNYEVLNEGNAFTLHFDAGAKDAVCSLDEIESCYGKTFAVDEKAVSRPGYELEGWQVLDAEGQSLDENCGLIMRYKDEEDADKVTGYYLKDEYYLVPADYLTVLNGPAGAHYTLRAKWSPISYTIAFESGEAETQGEMEELSHTYGEELTLPENAYESDELYFGGWRVYDEGEQGWRCADEDGQIAFYASLKDAKKDGFAPVLLGDEAEISGLCEKAEGTVSLVAQWVDEIEPEAKIVEPVWSYPASPSSEASLMGSLGQAGWTPSQKITPAMTQSTLDTLRPGFVSPVKASWQHRLEK